MTRSSQKAKKTQLQHIKKYKTVHKKEAKKAVEDLKKAVLEGKNTFEILMKVCFCTHPFANDTSSL